ncbi:hypothetical protein UCDDA912_g09088 [Diaporthe ampelina]|uniref:Class v n=1 Tax=Diaporthe ampelina TaxID=1214573 RepID=A0A0G2F8E2_9PEZI|nr:hypothetical protein UCDDA912_g09088 [Diaporthe ampelina]
MLTNFGLKMAIMILMNLLMGSGHADVVPHNAAIFFDNNTLLAPNLHGDTILYTIVDMTWELDIPGAPEKINITGTANKAIQHINTHFPDYVWPDAGEYNTDWSVKETPDPVAKCDVFDLAPYPLASYCQEGLAQLGYHFFNLGSGPRTCAQAHCMTDQMGRNASIWWCNDDGIGASVPAKYLADLATDIISTCVEFDTPMSWTHGQIFDKTMPYNVIVNGGEPCR